MTPAMWGAVLGALAAGGVLLVVVRLQAIRRPQLALRVTPYVRPSTACGLVERITAFDLTKHLK